MGRMTFMLSLFLVVVSLIAPVYQVAYPGFIEAEGITGLEVIKRFLDAILMIGIGDDGAMTNLTLYGPLPLVLIVWSWALASFASSSRRAAGIACLLSVLTLAALLRLPAVLEADWPGLVIDPGDGLMTAVGAHAVLFVYMLARATNLSRDPLAAPAVE